MVTAILPVVAARPLEVPAEQRQTWVAQTSAGNGHVSSPSIESEATITPARFVSRHSHHAGHPNAEAADSEIASSTSRVAGFVGMSTGCGALIALAVFLPLPAKFQYAGVGEKAALKDSFYIVAAVAFVLAVLCFFGLRHLHEESSGPSSRDKDFASETGMLRFTALLTQFSNNFRIAVLVGFQRAEIAIGYLGGFVARASSVGISLFIPLLVNAMFLSSGLCEKKDVNDDPTGLPDIKRRCPQAYVVAAELTGVAETVALIFAPIFGYWTAKVSRKELPLLVASVAGIIGYPLFANQFDPDNSNTAKRVTAFIAVALIGISQIGAIVCSLGTLSKGVLMGTPKSSSVDTSQEEGNDSHIDEADPLLTFTKQPKEEVSLSSLKGSVAGVYSLYGGAAILILTKVGGLLFDKLSLAAPFYIMAIFNAMLMVVCAIASVWKRDEKVPSEDSRPVENN